MSDEKKPRGRPVGSKKENPADQRLPHIRVTQDQIDSYKNAAEQSDKSLSAWVKQTLDKAAKKLL